MIKDKTQKTLQLTTAQMEQQRFALKAGLDVSLLNGTWEQMKEQRLMLNEEK